MKLVSAKVTNYKSIDDSGEVKIDSNVTALVGLNESGKSAFLESLNKSLPVDTSYRFDYVRDYPRKNLTDYERRHATEPAVVTHLTYALSPEEVQAINADLGVTILNPNDATFTYLTNYGGGTTVLFSVDDGPFIRAQLARLDNVPAPIAAKRLTALHELIKALAESDLTDSGKKVLADLTSRFAEAAKAWPRMVLEYYIWSKHLKPNLPSFGLFDDYQLLPGKVNLPQLQERLKGKNLRGEDRAILALLRLANVDLATITQAKGYESEKSRLEGLGNKITDRIFEYWSQNKNLQVEFDIKTDPSDQAPFNVGPNLYIRVRNTRHRVTVPFDLRSKGFIWFFSFLAWFDSVEEQIGTDRSLVLLLDEPGLNLHALAQDDLLNYIDRLSTRYQVVYTTHSPFMVRSDRLDRVRTVEDRDVGGTTISDNVSTSGERTVFPLQAALGYTLAQNLFVAKKNLVVEGISDLAYLSQLSERLSTLGRAGLVENAVVAPIGGLDRILTFAALLNANKLDLVILHDSKGKPEQQIDDAVRNKLIDARRVLNCGMFLGTEVTGNQWPPADIEDLFTPSTYLNLFKAAFAAELQGHEIREADLPKGDRILDRIERHLAAKRIQLRPSGGFNHYTPARYLLSQPKFKVDAATLKRFESLFEKVNKLLAT